MPDADPFTLVVATLALPDEGGSAAFSQGGWSVLVCRSGGRIFAVENKCTHRDQKLEGGRIRRGTIFCPHHGASFALATGACGPPATNALRVFVCREGPAGVTIELPRH